MTTRPPDPTLAGAVLLEKTPGGPTIAIPEELAPRDANDEIRHQHTATLVYQTIQLFGQGRFVQAATSLFVAIESNYRELEDHVITALNRAEALADMLEEASKTIPALDAAIKKRTDEAILANITPERYEAAKVKLAELVEGAGTCDGNHAEPPCADYRCWCKDPADAEDAHELVGYLRNMIATVDAAGWSPPVSPVEDDAGEWTDDPRLRGRMPPDQRTRLVTDDHLADDETQAKVQPLIDEIINSQITDAVTQDAEPELATGGVLGSDQVDAVGEVPPISAQDLNREEGQ